MRHTYLVQIAPWAQTSPETWRSWHCRDGAAYSYCRAPMNTTWVSSVQYGVDLETRLWARSDGHAVLVEDVSLVNLVPTEYSSPVVLEEMVCVYRDSLWLPGRGLYTMRRSAERAAVMTACLREIVPQLDAMSKLLDEKELLQIAEITRSRAATYAGRLVARSVLAYLRRRNVHEMLSAVSQYMPQVALPVPHEVRVAMELLHDASRPYGTPWVAIELMLGVRTLTRNDGDVWPVMPQLEKIP